VTLEKYKALLDFNNWSPGANGQNRRTEPSVDSSTQAASSADSALQDLRVSVLVKNCAIVTWTTSLSPVLKPIGLVVDRMEQHQKVCESSDIFRLATGSATRCTANDKDKSTCVEVETKFDGFKTIAPYGNVLPFAENVGARTTALLQQLH